MPGEMQRATHPSRHPGTSSVRVLWSCRLWNFAFCWRSRGVALHQLTVWSSHSTIHHIRSVLRDAFLANYHSSWKTRFFISFLTIFGSCFWFVVLMLVKIFVSLHLPPLVWFGAVIDIPFLLWWHLQAWCLPARDQYALSFSQRNFKGHNSTVHSSTFITAAQFDLK